MLRCESVSFDLHHIEDGLCVWSWFRRLTVIAIKFDKACSRKKHFLNDFYTKTKCWHLEWTAGHVFLNISLFKKTDCSLEPSLDKQCKIIRGRGLWTDQKLWSNHAAVHHFCALVVSYGLLGWRLGLLTIGTHLAFRTEVDRIRLGWIENDWTGLNWSDWTGLKLNGSNQIGLGRILWRIVQKGGKFFGGGAGLSKKNRWGDEMTSDSNWASSLMY